MLGCYGRCGSLDCLIVVTWCLGRSVWNRQRMITICSARVAEDRAIRMSESCTLQVYSPKVLAWLEDRLHNPSTRFDIVGNHAHLNSLDRPYRTSHNPLANNPCAPAGNPSLHSLPFLFAYE